MKKLLLLLLLIPLVSFGQDKEKKGLEDILEQVKKLAKEVDIDGLINKPDTKAEIPLQPLIKTAPALKTEVSEQYKLYPTENTYNHLMLNTATGAIWQVQWSTDWETRFSTVINSETLVPRDEYEWLDDLPAGRFKLYPTKNTYTFLLLDVKLGKTWQVQWSFEAYERFIIPIN